MKSVTFTSKGDFSKTINFLEKAKNNKKIKEMLEKYAKEGVTVLMEVTPKSTGKTAASWDYTIEITKDEIAIYWTNSNLSNGTPVALLIQYGHATRTGKWISGIDYITPAIEPIFEKMSKEIWREVTK